jgi:transposase
MDSLSKESKRGAIQYEIALGELNLIEIAKKVGVNINTVRRWKDTKSVDRKDRVTKTRKINREKKAYIRELASDKFTGSEKASSREITRKLKIRYKDLKISFQTVNTCLKNILSKPRKAGKTFLMTENNRGQRRIFADYVTENNITGRDILFTDEKRFLLNAPLNKQNNQIRLSKESVRKFKRGCEIIDAKINRQFPKFSSSFMVAGGVSYYGPGKLIFCVGNMNAKSYRPALDFYKQDIDRLNPNLYLQQDGASSHTSVANKAYITAKFRNKLELWPANVSI